MVSNRKTKYTKVVPRNINMNYEEFKASRKGGNQKDKKENTQIRVVI